MSVRIRLQSCKHCGAQGSEYIGQYVTAMADALTGFLAKLGAEHNSPELTALMRTHAALRMSDHALFPVSPYGSVFLVHWGCLIEMEHERSYEQTIAAEQERADYDAIAAGLRDAAWEPDPDEEYEKHYVDPSLGV